MFRQKSIRVSHMSVACSWAEHLLFAFHPQHHTTSNRPLFWFTMCISEADISPRRFSLDVCPPPTHKRYCINGNVLKFVSDSGQYGERKKSANFSFGSLPAGWQKPPARNSRTRPNCDISYATSRGRGRHFPQSREPQGYMDARSQH